jgi:hypothetical protein
VTDTTWKYVVHAPGQGWMVDDFIKQGKVPVDCERIESQACPRGKLFLLPDMEHFFKIEVPPHVYEPRFRDLAEEAAYRERERLVENIIKRELESMRNAPPATLVTVVVA